MLSEMENYYIPYEMILLIFPQHAILFTLDKYWKGDKN